MQAQYDELASAFHQLEEKYAQAVSQVQEVETWLDRPEMNATAQDRIAYLEQVSTQLEEENRALRQEARKSNSPEGIELVQRVGQLEQEVQQSRQQLEKCASENSASGCGTTC